MNLTGSIKWNIYLQCLFHEYFSQVPHLLGSECWILSYHKSYNTNVLQKNQPKSFATAVLENKLKTDI